MNLNQRLQHELANLAPFSTGEHVLEIEADGRHLRCQLVALDSLACAFMRLTLRADSLVGRSPEQLRELGETLSAKLTYLLEPIRPIELDAEESSVQLRSTPPHKESNRTTYYELLASRRGELTLCRYSRLPGQQRQEVPAHVTREVLARLVSDFAAAVQ
jgi:hypothetical protein